MGSGRNSDLLGEPGMTKPDVLEYIADAGRADAMDVANAFGITYAAAAMALLRLTWQGLVHRYLDPHDGLYFYELSERGQALLAFFRAHH